MTDNWDSYFCDVEGKPASLLVNLGLADAAPLAGYPVSAYVSVFLKAPDQHGFPGDKEYDALSRIEDAFMAAAAAAPSPPALPDASPGTAPDTAPGNTPDTVSGDAPDIIPGEAPHDVSGGAPGLPGGVYAGRCATNGRFILFFYLPAAFGGASLQPRRGERDGETARGQSWGARAEAVMAAFPDYAWEAGAEEDPEWKAYTEFLFPEGFALLGIQNARLLRDLAEAGDDTSLSRRIDHFALFPDIARAEAFLDMLDGLGFALTGLDRADEDNTDDTGGAQEVPTGNPGGDPDSDPHGDEAFAKGVRVRFSRSDAPDSMDEVTCILWDAAAGQGGVYEGWAACVTPAEDAAGASGHSGSG